jgi:hypothetical protein
MLPVIRQISDNQSSRNNTPVYQAKKCSANLIIFQFDGQIAGPGELND